MTDKHSHVVEVIYALRDVQPRVSVAYEDGMTAQDAVDRSGLAERFPEIYDGPVLGVYNVAVRPEHELKPGDRVEICRPLQADPREMRKSFVTGGRVMGGACAAERPKKPAAK